MLPGGDGKKRADGEGKGAQVEGVGRVGGAAAQRVRTAALGECEAYLWFTREMSVQMAA